MYQKIDVYLYFLHCSVFLQRAIAVIYRHCQDLNGLFIIVNFYSVVAAYIFYLVQYVISNYILGKKALKLLIPVRGWFAAKEGGSIDLKG